MDQPKHCHNNSKYIKKRDEHPDIIEYINDYFQMTTLINKIMKAKNLKML